MKVLPQGIVAACSVALWLLTPAPAVAQRTVCTITVNSPDEQETFRRHLPEPGHRFVELVERSVVCVEPLLVESGAIWID